MIALNYEGCSCWRTNTIRATHSWTSGEYFTGLFIIPSLKVGASEKARAAHFAARRLIQIFGKEPRDPTRVESRNERITDVYANINSRIIL